MNLIPIEIPDQWTEYELIDSGGRKKLERFGTYRVSRPDPRALWAPALPPAEWDKAEGQYIYEGDVGQWHFRTPAPEPWHLHYNGLTVSLKPTVFKHMGVFPEQAVNWDWLLSTIGTRTLKVLNLFAYTGAASIVSTLSGAKVTHLDSAKGTIVWAKENTRLSGLPDNSIRWIEEDAYKFVVREARRGNTYDGIIMDPPRFGRGSKGEVWKLADDLPKLLAACKAILSPEPAFFLINAYTSDLSALVVNHLLTDLMKPYGGQTTFAELALKATSNSRLLPNGIFARWQAH